MHKSICISLSSATIWTRIGKTCLLLTPYFTFRAMFSCSAWIMRYGEIYQKSVQINVQKKPQPSSLCTKMSGNYRNHDAATLNYFNKLMVLSRYQGMSLKS